VLRGLALDSRRIALPAGTVLARQGDPGHSLYVVSEGSLLVRKDGQEAARIPAGGLAGELALLTGETRSADLLAAETSLLLEVPRSALLRAVARTEGLAEALLRVARDRGFQALPAPSALSDEALRACTAEDSRLLADEAVARLRAVPLFAALQAPTLAFLAKELETLEIPAGRGVVRRGSSITSLGVVVSGAMGVEIEGRAVARLQVGDFYGEIGLLSGRVATADVRAISASRIARLDWRAIRGAVGMEPAFGLRLLEAVLDHVAALRAAGGDVEGLSAAGRLARLVDGSELSDVDLGQSTQGLRYGLATEAHMDFAGIRALKQAVDAGGAADFVLSPAGLRRGRGTGGAPPSNGERPLSRDALAAALAQSPELLRALAAQAVVKV
jgi:CRP-like cAMP-binding protein